MITKAEVAAQSLKTKSKAERRSKETVETILKEAYAKRIRAIQLQKLQIKQELLLKIRANC